MTKQELRDFLDKVKIDPVIEERSAADIIMGDDGYYVYWPTGSLGYFSEHALLTLAAIINKRNREWDDDVDEFFR